MQRVGHFWMQFNTLAFSATFGLVVAAGLAGALVSVFVFDCVMILIPNLID